MPNDVQKQWAEAFAKVAYNLPNEQERNRMSAIELAQLLARYEIGTPPYILIEHELNLRLGEKQIEATLRSSRIGAGSTIFTGIISAVLGYLAGAL